jgi:predicted Zn-dependent peptidase
VQAHFGDLRPNKAKTYEPATYTGGDKRAHKADLEQTHILLGFESIARDDPQFYAARAMTNILGGGMSSRLFQEVREKRGLVYSVFAFNQVMQDSGLFGIYAGTGPDQTQTLMPVLCDEIAKIKNDGVTADELTRVKAQMKASLLMGQESMMRRADTIAKTLLHKDEVYDPSTVIEQIDALEIAAIQSVAQNILGGAAAFSAIGPLENLLAYEDLSAQLQAA